MITLSLKELRAVCGKTQKQVAEAMGVSQSEVSRIELRTGNPKEVMEAYVKALGGKLTSVAQFKTWKAHVEGSYVENNQTQATKGDKAT